MHKARLGLLLIVVLILASFAPVRAACSGSAGGCTGTCPVLMFCGLLWPEMTACACQPASGGGCGGKVLEVVGPETAFAAVLSDASGGPKLFDVGNGITLTQSKQFGVEIHHSSAWGAGVQTVTIPNGILTATIHVTGVDASNPNRRTFVVKGIGAVLPSFASIALGGAMTGDNTFSADPDRSGGGWVDTTTGAFHVQLYARMFNGTFQAHPALVQTVADGTINLMTRKVTITGMPEDIQVVAASPDTTLW